MKLVGMLTSPYTRRVAIGLTDLGICFAHVAISAFSGITEFRALNPVARAPTLFLDDGSILMDSHVILEHFDRSAGERSLWPRDAGLRARAAALLGFTQTACDKAVQLIYEREMRPSDKQYADWSNRVSAQITAACALLEDLAEPDVLWLEPGRLTLAGISLAVLCTFMGHRVPDLWDGQKFPKLGAFREQAEELAVFRRWAYPPAAPSLAAAPLWP